MSILVNNIVQLCLLINFTLTSSSKFVSSNVVCSFHWCSHCHKKDGNLIFSFNFSSLPFSDDQQYLSVGKSLLEKLPPGIHL